jgi:hypothetical protein
MRNPPSAAESGTIMNRVEQGEKAEGRQRELPAFARELRGCRRAELLIKNP